VSSVTRSALVTGASRGIGRGVVEGLAAQGWSVTVTARDDQQLVAMATALSRPGVVIQPVAGDMSEEADLQRIVEAHRSRFATMDALILSAGVGSAGSIETYPMRRYDKQFAVNVRAPFRLIQDCLAMLRAAAEVKPALGAKVIGLASISGVYAEADLAVYGACKSALISLLRSLNLEESESGVSACAISPGYVDTDMSAWIQDRIPAEKMIPVSDVVHTVLSVLGLSARTVLPEIVMTRAGRHQYDA
jgi:3-oxoacyl-[acyl-carrier protein] reductase